MRRRVIYAGDGPKEGAARYLLGVIKFLRYDVIHIPPEQIFPDARSLKKINAVILSDYSRSQIGRSEEKLLMERIQRGLGFAMIGGWGSFQGPFGHWGSSLLESILPIRCRKLDDRVNFPSGAWVMPSGEHFLTKKSLFKQPPVICGLNDVSVRPGAKVLINARGCRFMKGRPVMSSKKHPLCVISGNPKHRILTLMTDLAPHWCGGLVDWGGTPCVLKVDKGVSIEVGKSYVEWVGNMIRWLCRDR